MMARNMAAHQVYGDGVLEILPDCGNDLQELLRMAFKFLWKVSPDRWDEATPEEKLNFFRQ